MVTWLFAVGIFALFFFGLGLKLFLTGRAMKRSCKATSDIVGGRDMCACSRVTRRDDD